MVQAHFVRDYQSHIRNLIAAHPLDEAMSLAVGGDYDRIGAIQVDILVAAGLNNKHSIIDIGCGSGRLAKHLGLRFPELAYLGTDVVPELLGYAAKRAPDNYRFLHHEELSIPAEDQSADYVTAFSVFTHLFHEESYIYLRDAQRVLKTGGAVIFSFLEFAQHWAVFETMIHPDWQVHKPHVNMFIERSAIKEWAIHLGLTIERFDFGPSLGQSTILLRKPMNLSMKR